MIFLSFADFFFFWFFKINFQEHYKSVKLFWIQIRTDSLFVGSDLSPNCLQRYQQSANTSKEIVKITIFKMIILGGISSDLQSEIKFYGATLVEL